MTVFLKVVSDHASDPVNLAYLNNLISAKPSIIQSLRLDVMSGRWQHVP